MIDATFFDAVGRIIQSMTLLDEGEVMANLPDGAQWMPGKGDPRTQYVRDAALHTYPEKPGPWAVFDFATGEWADPRTPEDLAAEAAAALAAWRESAVCTPAQIRLALRQMDLLATIEALVSGDADAMIAWQFAQGIRRNSYFITALGGNMFTPEQIDDIFAYALTVQVG